MNKKIISNIVKLLRPHQWIKNLFVFAGIFFAHGWHNQILLESVLWAFVAFCLMSSAVYIYNDIVDRRLDRVHPQKKHRPLASQAISVHFAGFMAAGLFLLSLGISFLSSPKVSLIISGYFCLNLAYTYILKNLVILDIFAIASGFMLRILAGTLGVGISPSPWLLFCGLMITLFLGFTKRRAEGMLFEKTVFISRKVLNEYNTIFLDKMIGITATCSIIGYGLYAMSPATIRVHHTSALIYTLPFVVYGIFRYIYLLHRKTAKPSGEDAAKDLLTDVPLLITLLLWAVAVFYCIA